MNMVVIVVGILVGRLSELRQEAILMAEQLEQAKEEKTRFFINLAHETKTPLTLIDNYLKKYIKKKGADPDLKVMSRNIEKLKQNMINFLDYEKLERGQEFYDHGNITNVSLTLENAIKLFRAIAVMKNIKINSNIEKNITVMADPYAIARIINNLMDNALKYSEKNGRIDVVLKTNKHEVEFIVKDTGIGISEEQLEHIFKSYYQISHTKRNTQGIGMGLNIVKRILEDIGGRIEVSSRLGDGAEFRVYFKTLADPSLHAEGKVVKTTEYKLHFDKYKEIPIESVPQAGRYNLLVVEDNHDMLAYLQNSLREFYNVDCAFNGKQALEKLESTSKIHLVISDIMMDVMDGYEFYEELKKDDKYSGQPVIFLTAKNSQQEKLKALKKGVVDFINKPFDIEELKAKINSIIKLTESQFEKSRRELIKHLVEASKRNISEVDYCSMLEKKYKEYQISDREKEIILLLIAGKPLMDIAKKLFISKNTVKTHIKHIYEKCGVQNRYKLMRIFKMT